MLTNGDLRTYPLKQDHTHRADPRWAVAPPNRDFAGDNLRLGSVAWEKLSTASI